MEIYEQKIIWHKDIPKAITFEDRQLIITLNDDYNVSLWRWDNKNKEFYDFFDFEERWAGHSSIQEIKDIFEIKAWAFFEYPTFKKEESK